MITVDVAHSLPANSRSLASFHAAGLPFGCTHIVGDLFSPAHAEHLIVGPVARVGGVTA